MEKYKSEIVKENELKIETNIYTSCSDDNNDVKMYAVKLTHITTGLEVAIHTNKGNLYTYNSGLKKLEDKLKGLKN